MSSEIRRLGRYALHRQIASGGMASVHLGRLLGPAGFSRTVAIKRLHPQLAQDASFVAMFLDEARVTGRIVHPNIVSTIDVVQERGELFIVMDFVQGAALSSLMQISGERGEAIDPAIAVGVVTNALAGLHAAHEAIGEGRRPLLVIHRDVSPHNILVGTDGTARIADFGIAKAVGRMQSTTQGQLKGKLSYMAPEVIRGAEIDRRVDVYGTAVVLWELLTGERLFKGHEATVLYDVLEGEVEAPSSVRPGSPPALDAIVLKGLAKQPADRFATAAEFADALERALSPASARQIGAWVESLASADLSARATLLEELERTADQAPPVSEARVPGKSAPERPDASVEATVVEPRRVPRADVVVERTVDEAPVGVRRADLERRRSPTRTMVLVGLSVGAIAAGVWHGWLRAPAPRPAPTTSTAPPVTAALPAPPPPAEAPAEASARPGAPSGSGAAVTTPAPASATPLPVDRPAAVSPSPRPPQATMGGGATSRSPPPPPSAPPSAPPPLPTAERPLL